MRDALFLFFLVLGAANAQNRINFKEGNVAEILESAKAANKPVCYMFYATWCAHCNKMKDEVFANPDVADFYNQSFITAKQDMESGAGIEMRKRFGVKSYPTFVFFDTNGEVIYRIAGEFKAQDFINEGKNARDPKKQFTYLKSEFLSEVSNPDKALAYIIALRKGGMDAHANDVAKKYLVTQTEPQLVTPLNWKIIANGLRDMDSREFRYVLQNQKEFAAVSSAIRVEKKIMNMVSESLAPFVDASDTVTYNKNRHLAVAIHLPKTDSLISSYDVKISENVKNWKNYRKATREYVPKYAMNDARKLKEIAMAYMNNIDGKEALNDAVFWAGRALELNATYDIYIILGRLQLKNGNKSAAKQWAEKGKILAQSYKWDTKQADEILNQIN